MDIEHKAIERIQYAAEVSEQYYNAPLIITYSGGKDSEVLLALALRAGIDFEAQHSHTTADAPETVYHVRKRFAALESEGIPCKINYPQYKGRPTSMWDLIPRKMMPPTQIVRYCCEILKEQNGRHHCIVTGVRWAESSHRAKNRGFIDIGRKDANGRYILFADNDEGRRGFETCPIKAKTIINPIIDWSDAEVWDFTHSEHLPINPLYGCGLKGWAASGAQWLDNTGPLNSPDTLRMNECIGVHLRECWRHVKQPEKPIVKQDGKPLTMYFYGGCEARDFTGS